MKPRILSTLLLLFGVLTLNAQSQIYELRTYELEFFGQADLLHNYFEKALIPALNRQGVNNIGAFEETSEALPAKIYLLIPYDNLQAIETTFNALATDNQYQEDGASYLKSPPGAPIYSRITTNLILASTGFPNLVKPADDSEFFELRIYESYNEDALRRKVKMFNDSEFDIFADVGLPTVFFGSNIAGDQMPCLTYMLAFKDKAAHSAAWSKFGDHPEWKRITQLEEFFDAMNDITRVFLKPLAYSQL
jgi:hypothetical protein